MQVDVPTSDIEPCECGYKPLRYSIGYGPNPYYITCCGCKKQLSGGSGLAESFVELWNNDYRHRKLSGKFIDLTVREKQQ